MKIFEVIPAIDLIGGNAVRLLHGDFSRATTYGDPVENAVRFKNAGMRRLHIVDLDGARTGVPHHLEVLRRIAAETDLVIDYGGGIRTIEGLESVFEAGASMVTVGSVAFRDPPMVRGWFKRFGARRFILAADLKDGAVALEGWKNSSRLTVPEYVAPYLQYGEIQVMCTSIARDGALTGPDFDCYTGLKEMLPKDVALIASGGVSSCEDLRRLREMGLSGAIVGKALYEGRVELSELGEFVC